MIRFLKISLTLSFIACAVHADEQPAPKPKRLPDELKQLHGYWVSGPKEFSKDLKGHMELRFEFKVISPPGQTHQTLTFTASACFRTTNVMPRSTLATNFVLRIMATHKSCDPQHTSF